MSFNEILDRLAPPADVLERTRSELTSAVLQEAARRKSLDEAKAVVRARLDGELAETDADNPRLAERILETSERAFHEACRLAEDAIAWAESHPLPASD
jgi:hypothetical protein